MTFSVGTKGAIAGNEFPNNATTTRGVVLPDSTTNSNYGATVSTAVRGGVHGAMATGAQVLVQMPDGSQRWMVFAEGSTFDYPKLLPVGP